MQSGLNVIVVDADLMGTARFEAAQAATGALFRFVAAKALVDALRSSPADLLILDLDRGREGALDVLDHLRASDLLPPEVVAFVSHIDENLASTARERGYETWPRGRLWRSLEEVLSRS